MEDRQLGNMVMYGAIVRSFRDSDDDGIGDLAGLLERLDYLEWLGITCLWILPVFPSGGRDNGYDVTNYIDIASEYGTLDDFKHVVDEVHRRGMRVMIDLVAHHTSNRHPWFQAARRSARSAFRDYYTWTDDPPDGPQ